MNSKRHGQNGQLFAQTALFCLFSSLFLSKMTAQTMISAGELRASGFVWADMGQFDFETRCKIVSYTIARQIKGGDIVEWDNAGHIFTVETQQKFAAVRSGDRVFFDDIKCLCPGDPATRNLGSLAFKIR